MRRVVLAIEWLLRHLIVYPAFRLFFRNEYSDKQIELQYIRKILILRFDRIGDMIVTTPIFKALKKRNPSLQIGVFTGPANAELIRNTTDVDATYILQANWCKLLQEILRARSERYDVVLNFIFNRTTSAGILANLVAPGGFKVGQGAEKYRFYFNRLLRLDRTQRHMVEVLAYYVEQVFGVVIPADELQFEIVIDSRSRSFVDGFLESRHLARRQLGGSGLDRYFVFNVSATDFVRKMSYEQMIGLVQHLAGRSTRHVIIIAAPVERHIIERIVGRTDSERCHAFPERGASSLLEIASLIEGAECVFTPDTSIIHFASATKTPVMGFFTPLQMAHEWVPYNVHHVAVYAPPGKLTSAIPLTEITAQAERFFATLEQKETFS